MDQQPWKEEFRSSHFAQPNILAHVRFNERTDADGARVLFIEEFQSDWAQQGRKEGFANLNEIQAMYERVGEIDAQKSALAKDRDPTTNQMRDEKLWHALSKESENLYDEIRRAEVRVPAAPFVGKTDAWVALALKRMIRYAAENDFDRIAWTRGEQQVERYTGALRKAVDVIEWTKIPDGIQIVGYKGGSGAPKVSYEVQSRAGQVYMTFDTRAEAQGFIIDGYDEITARNLVIHKVVDANLRTKVVDTTKKEDALSDAIGKAMADRIINDPAQSGTIEGENIRVDDTGMAGFYDRIVPNIANDLLKKLGGGKVHEIDIGREENEGAGARGTGMQPGFDISPALRAAALDGLPLFARQPRRMLGIPAAADPVVSSYRNANQLKAHPDYAKAKAGDNAAAVRLVRALVNPETLKAAKQRFPGATFLAPAAIEAAGTNKIPAALAAYYAANTKGKADGRTVVQVNRAFHTGANAMERMIARPRFDGVLKPGKYVLVDDVTTLGGTLAELANHVRGQGGEVVGIVTLVDASRSGRMVPQSKLVKELKRRYGDAIRDTLGIEPEALTQPEAGYLIGFRDADALRNRAAKARDERRGRLLSKGIRASGSEVGDEPSAARAGQAALTDTRNPYTRIATRALNALDRVLDPVGTLPQREAYLKRRYRTLGVIAKGDEIAKEIRQVFLKAGIEDQQAAYDYLTTADAQPDGFKSVAVRDQAVRIKRIINSVGDALVKRGLLSEEAREEHRDAYLPRLYLKYLLNEADFKAMGAGKKPSDMGYLKQRKDIPEEVRRVILGEVKEPGFLAATAIAKPLRDMAILDWLDSIAQNEDWVLPKSVMRWKGNLVSPYWLKEEADRLRRQTPYYDAPDAKKARQIAAEMDAAADAALIGMPPERKLFRQIPNHSKFGRLRGIWVRKEIYDDIMGVNDFLPSEPGFVQSVFGYGGIGTKVTQWWKMGKVALNPPAQVRNFVSNGVLLQLSGVPLHKVPTRVVQAWLDIVNDGKFWKVAKKYGVTESTFAAQELYRMKRELLDLESVMGKLGPLGRLRRMGAIVAEKASDFYQFSEALFKTAKIIDEMKNGTDEATAALEAQKWLFDYSLVHKGVRYTRNAPIGMPFITFQIKVLPRLLEVAALHPQRFLPWAAMLCGAAYGMAAALDVDDDDLKKLMLALPEWIRKRGHAMLLPWKDEHGRWQVLDLGYYFPWTYWTELAGNLKSGDLTKTATGAGLLSGPVTSIITALLTGIDSFTGRQIMNPGDPPKRRLLSALNYAWSLAAPPILTDYGAVGHAVRAYSGETNRYGDPRSSYGQAALRAFGVNIYALEPEQTRNANLYRMRTEIGETERVLKRKLQDRSLTEPQRVRLLNEYTEELNRRRDALLKHQKDSELNPKLATP